MTVEYLYCRECGTMSIAPIDDEGESPPCIVCGCDDWMTDGEMRDLAEGIESSAHWPRTWGDL